MTTIIDNSDSNTTSDENNFTYAVIKTVSSFGFNFSIHCPVAAEGTLPTKVGQISELLTSERPSKDDVVIIR